MDNVQKAIDLARTIGIPVEDITFNDVANTRTAIVWEVYDKCDQELYYIVEDIGSYTPYDTLEEAESAIGI